MADSINKLDKANVENPSSTSAFDIENYGSLFSPLYRRKMKIIITLTHKLRTPISIFKYDGRYKVVITQLKINPNSNLSHNFYYKFREFSVIGPVVAALIDEGDFTVNYRSKSTEYGTNINFF